MKNEVFLAIKHYLELEETNKSHIAVNEKTAEIYFWVQTGTELVFSQVLIQVHEESYSVKAMCPIRAPTENPVILSNMAEFACLVNLELEEQVLHFDPRNGEIFAKCYIAYNKHIPSKNTIARSIYNTSAILHRFCTGILAILYRGINAETAVRLREGERVNTLIHLLKKRRSNNSIIQDLLWRPGAPNSVCRDSTAEESGSEEDINSALPVET